MSHLKSIFTFIFSEKKTEVCLAVGRQRILSKLNYLFYINLYLYLGFIFSLWACVLIITLTIEVSSLMFNLLNLKCFFYIQLKKLPLMCAIDVYFTAQSISYEFRSMHTYSFILAFYVVSFGFSHTDLTSSPYYHYTDVQVISGIGGVLFLRNLYFHTDDEHLTHILDWHLLGVYVLKKEKLYFSLQISFHLHTCFHFIQSFLTTPLYTDYI